MLSPLLFLISRIYLIDLRLKFCACYYFLLFSFPSTAAISWHSGVRYIHLREHVKAIKVLLNTYVPKCIYYLVYLSYICHDLGKHCGASVSKQYAAAMNSYIAKALPLKCQITAHRPWHVASKVCYSTVWNSLEKVVMIAENSL